MGHCDDLSVYPRLPGARAICSLAGGGAGIGAAAGIRNEPPPGMGSRWKGLACRLRPLSPRADPSPGTRRWNEQHREYRRPATPEQQPGRGGRKPGCPGQPEPLPAGAGCRWGFLTVGAFGKPHGGVEEWPNRSRRAQPERPGVGPIGQGTCGTSPNSRSSSVGSTGFTRWWSKPASCERQRASSDE
jgi:hypothetical protein